jgi:DnaJ-class molecular chaperone
MVDLYNILGVSRSADVSDIRTAYKQLAREHHPDKGGDPEKFKELSQAHEILSDPQRRKMYDMTGSVSDQPQGMSGNPFGGMHGGNPFGGMPGGMAGVFSHMFGGMSGGGAPGSRRRREGKSPGKTQDIPLTFLDYYQGRVINIKFARQCFCKVCKGSGAASTKTCESCNGAGQVRQVVQMGPMQMVTEGPCHVCGGSGEQPIGQCSGCQGKCFIQEAKNLEIKVEPGMMPGNTVVFPGMCSDSHGFTEAGDVTVVLREADEGDLASNWVREGTRLKTSVTINLTEALLGTSRVLNGHPGFPGGVPIDIPVGVQNLWTGTIPGLGMPIRGTPKFGEAYITVIVVPTAEETNALKSQSEQLKSFLPTISSQPQCSEASRSGTWSMV